MPESSVAGVPESSVAGVPESGVAGVPESGVAGVPESSVAGVPESSVIIYTPRNTIIETQHTGLSIFRPSWASQLSHPPQPSSSPPLPPHTPPEWNASTPAHEVAASELKDQSLPDLLVTEGSLQQPDRNNIIMADHSFWEIYHINMQHFPTFSLSQTAQYFPITHLSRCYSRGRLVESLFLVESCSILQEKRNCTIEPVEKSHAKWRMSLSVSCLHIAACVQ